MKDSGGVGVSCEMIIKKGSKILMGERGSVFGKGTWAFPGGHLESTEKVEDCVRRELKEETGIKPTKLNLIGIVNDIPDIPGQARHYIRFVFLVESFTGEIINKEPEKCEGWEWFDIKALPKPIFVGHVKPLKLFLSNKKEFFVE